MLIKNDSINFSSKFLPSEPLQKAFQKYFKNTDIIARRRFTNHIDALVNDGKQDVFELKEIVTPSGKQIRAYINEEDSQFRCAIREDISHADAASELIFRITRSRNPVNKFQKFGFRKLKELYDNIFLKN